MTFPARLTELLEKATKGPWYAKELPEDSDFGGIRIYSSGIKWSYEHKGETHHADTEITSCNCCCCGTAGIEAMENAELIAYLVNHAEAIRDLVVAAKKAQEAMNVWVNTYAPEFCDKERVENSRKIISESGGTLAYIADINEQIHEALAKLGEA